MNSFQTGERFILLLRIDFVANPGPISIQPGIVHLSFTRSSFSTLGRIYVKHSLLKTQNHVDSANSLMLQTIQPQIEPPLCYASFEVYMLSAVILFRFVIQKGKICRKVVYNNWL